MASKKKVGDVLEVVLLGMEAEYVAKHEEELKALGPEPPVRWSYPTQRSHSRAAYCYDDEQKEHIAATKKANDDYEERMFVVRRLRRLLPLIDAELMTVAEALRDHGPKG